MTSDLHSLLGLNVPDPPRGTERGPNPCSALGRLAEPWKVVNHHAVMDQGGQESPPGGAAGKEPPKAPVDFTPRRCKGWLHG